MDIRMHTPAEIVTQLMGEIGALPVRNTPHERAIRKKYSAMLANASPEMIYEVGKLLIHEAELPWLGFELIASHKPCFIQLGEKELEQLGGGINSWWTVDSFARTLAGPAWLAGLVPDELIVRWASSGDPWWRRAALVSTVALNSRYHGGQGDATRTLRICRSLVSDRDDMVAKAMSWALRELVIHDAEAVRNFLLEHAEELTARVKREVTNKLVTGLKTRSKLHSNQGVR